MVNYLWLLSITSLVSAQTVINNEEIDKQLVRMNKLIRQYELQAVRIPSGKIQNDIRFGQGFAVGLDSLRRSADCTRTPVANFTNAYDFHVGFRHLSVFFDSVMLEDSEMAATIRPRNISLRLRMSVDTTGDCLTSLESFQVERLEDVLVGSSKKEFDGADLDHLFQTEVRGFLNLLLRGFYPKIAQIIQVYVCGYAEGPALLSGILH